VRRRAVSALAAALAVVAVVALGSAPRAGAVTTCGDRVIADWQDGHFDRSYTPSCLRQALQSLPEDLQVYSSAEADITRLLNRTLESRAEPAARQTRSLSGRNASVAPTHGVAAASATRVAGTSDGVPLVVVILAAAAAACAFAAAALAIRRRSARRTV